MSQQQAALKSWLEGRVDRWKWLEAACQTAPRGRDVTAQDALQFVEEFRALGRDYALAKATFPDAHLTRYLHALYATCRERLYRRPQRVWQSLRNTFLYAAPEVVSSMRGTVAAVIGLFVLSWAVAWWLVATYPELAALFASQQMIDMVEAGELWTDDLLNVLPSSVLSASIITNNVSVTLFAFALGAFHGLGTLYIIVMNGLMLGGVFSFVYQHQLGPRLLEFVIAHGVVELSVICLAGAAGTLLGEALMRPGERSRSDAFRHAVQRAGHLLVVIVPFLVGAGLIEGYISPNPDIGFAVKATIGVTYGIIFWVVLAGGRWARRNLRDLHPLSAA